MSGTAFAPLRIARFRTLWFTWLVANVCMWMNDVAAAWQMTTLSTSPLMVALVQTASMLPVMLLGLPSGALADILDRRRWFMATQLWVAIVAVVLALALVTGNLGAAGLLALTFANGIGLAMRWPVFAAIVPELVPRAQLGAALGLNALALNVSRVAGALIAGALIASAGVEYVFGLNAVLSLLAAWVIWRWRRAPAPAPSLPGERFVGAMRVGLQYVRQSPRMHAVLARIALFFLQSAALIALLPLTARRLEPDGAGVFTLLLAAMGAGALAGAVLLPRLATSVSRDAVVRSGTLAQAAATTIVALAHSPWLACVGMFVAGIAWLAVGNTLTVSAQMALPDWVRARGMAIFQMCFMGGNAAGAALWGQVASLTDLRTSLLASAAFGAAVSLLAWRLSVAGGNADELTPTTHWSGPPRAETPMSEQAGPILVTIEYQIDPVRDSDFRAAMADGRRARLQYGALSWELLQDVADPRRWVEYFLDENWVEHQRRFQRTTLGDVALRDRILAFHEGTQAPRVSRYLVSPP